MLPLLVLALPVWITALDDDGMTVRYRDREELHARQVEATYVIEAPPEKVFAVLDDVEKYPQFMPYLEKLTVLERFEGGRYQYELIDPPVVSKRDYVLKILVTKDAARGTYAVSWSPAPDKGEPPPEGVVRVTVNEGAFELAPHEKGTLLTYRLVTNPGGSIPAWIAKRSNTSSVEDLLKAIRKRVLAQSAK